jgi:hypothetical protein
MNINKFNRLSYDDCAYHDHNKQSTDPFNYRVSIDQVHNENRCFSMHGPRNSSFGCSTIGSNNNNVVQDRVALESILTNRNVKTNKCRTSDMVNPINPVTMMQPTFAPICDNKLKPSYTRLSHSSKNYKSMSVNRFYDVINNPQDVIYWDRSINTTLQARDNFIPNMPKPWSQTNALPNSEEGNQNCKLKWTPR